MSLQPEQVAGIIQKKWNNRTESVILSLIFSIYKRIVVTKTVNSKAEKNSLPSTWPINHQEINLKLPSPLLFKLETYILGSLCYSNAKMQK